MAAGAGLDLDLLVTVAAMALVAGGPGSWRVIEQPDQQRQHAVSGVNGRFATHVYNPPEFGSQPPQGKSTFGTWRNNTGMYSEDILLLWRISQQAT